MKCKHEGCDNLRRSTLKSSYLECGRCRMNRIRYGINSVEVDSLLQDQKGKCAICSIDVFFGNNKGGLKSNSAVVDHCHSVKTVRGILCRNCNLGLGSLKDDVKTMENAIKYLTKK